MTIAVEAVARDAAEGCTLVGTSASSGVVRCDAHADGDRGSESQPGVTRTVPASGTRLATPPIQ
jgi:hypothetical protein